MRGKRNIDRVPRGKRKPYMGEPEKPWSVAATGITGAHVDSMFFETEDQAKRHADWWFTNPTLTGIVIKGPPYSGKKHYPTVADLGLSSALMDAMEDRTVPPSRKHDIGRWMDSKAWGGEVYG